jgi:hypothetical protein
MSKQLSQAFSVKFRDGLNNCFNLEELKTLCFDLQVNYENIAGDTIDIKAKSIIEYFFRQGRLADLADYCASQRPNYDWPNIAETKSGEYETPKAKSRGATKAKAQKVKILFLAADPTDASRLRLGQELREIQERLQLAKLRSKFSLAQRMSVRPADISQAILDEKPRIVHFSGHGSDTGELCFENESGQARTVSPKALAALFGLVSEQIDCVLLNACYSAIQAKAIARHIKYVIGMDKAIGDGAAISFVIGFYQALGAGKSIEESYKFGCVQIGLQGIPEHLTPVLIRKRKTHP